MATLFLVLAGISKATSVSPGTATVGTTLTATPDLPTDSINWYHCSSAGVLDPGAIATGSTTYVIAEPDLQTYLCAQDTTTMTISSPIGPVTDPSEKAPTISGTAQVGHTLTAGGGTWGETPDPTDPIVYQWCRLSGTTCTAIANANASSYTLQASDASTDVEVYEAPVYGGVPDIGATLRSSAGDSVLPAAPSARTTSPPTISGTAADGQTLTASPGGFSGATRYGYQWLSCSAGNCTAIPRATSATLKLGDSQVGSTIEVAVTASNSGGSSAPATSSHTAVVTAGSTLGLLVSPTSANINQTVRMAAIVTSGVDSVAPDGTVTFYDDGTPIAGCTDQSVPAGDQSVTVVCPTSFGLSTPSISAVYTPADGTPLTGASSSAQSITVLSDPSSTTLDVPTIVKRGATVTYTANVAPANDLTGPVVPDGSVRFLNHGHAIRGCRAARISGGAATCTVHYRTTGRQRISAEYGGTASFYRSVSHVKTVRVVSSLPVNHGLRPLGSITSTMQWTFHYTPSYTRILALTLHGLSARSTVTVECSGHGCPYHRHTHLFTAGHPTFNLEHAFQRHRLGARAKVVIMLTRHRYVGKYYRFTIRARRQPSILISCLAPGSQRPGAGCRS